MFTVGEFSKIAQVSKRLLRYYDEIGLFTPASIDPATSRRFYTAEQLQDLNRILALKDLGLTLEQIQRMLNDHVSTDEIQGMLMLKKVEIENHLQEELQRIRMIESRLHAIRDTEEEKPLNVVIKQMDMQPVLSILLEGENFGSALDTMRRIRARLPERKGYGFCFVICHDEENHSIEEMKLEIGCYVKSDSHAIVPITDDIQLKYRQLPAVEMMATSVVHGPIERLMVGYAEIGKWAALNGYKITGLPREVTLQLPKERDGSDMITEIGFPVKMAATS